MPYCIVDPAYVAAAGKTTGKNIKSRVYDEIRDQP
jgi:hypothetical protein